LRVFADVLVAIVVVLANAGIMSVALHRVPIGTIVGNSFLASALGAVALGGAGKWRTLLVVFPATVVGLMLPRFGQDDTLLAIIHAAVLSGEGLLPAIAGMVAGLTIDARRNGRPLTPAVFAVLWLPAVIIAVLATFFPYEMMPPGFF
jgi:hypothetical protein